MRESLTGCLVRRLLLADGRELSAWLHQCQHCKQTSQTAARPRTKRVHPFADWVRRRHVCPSATSACQHGGAFRRICRLVSVNSVDWQTVSVSRGFRGPLANIPKQFSPLLKHTLCPRVVCFGRTTSAIRLQWTSAERETARMMGATCRLSNG